MFFQKRRYNLDIEALPNILGVKQLKPYKKERGSSIILGHCEKFCERTSTRLLGNNMPIIFADNIAYKTKKLMNLK
jgi:hypothetical protein